MNCVSIASDNYLNLNQCWLNVNWILINNHQWNLNRHSKFSFKIASENAVCKMADLSLYLNVINMRKCFLTFTPTATSTTDDLQKLKWFKIHWKLHSFNASCHHLTHWDRDKWPPFRRKHFQMHFLEWKCLNLDQNFTDVSSYGSNYQYSGIGSDGGLSPTRRQAIIWTNDGSSTGT